MQSYVQTYLSFSLITLLITIHLISIIKQAHQAISIFLAIKIDIILLIEQILWLLKHLIRKKYVITKLQSLLKVSHHNNDSKQHNTIKQTIQWASK